MPDPIAITWKRNPDGPGYVAGNGLSRWTVEPHGPRSWQVCRNGLPVGNPAGTEARTAKGAPRKRRQPTSAFWRTPEAAFKAAEELIRHERRAADLGIPPGDVEARGRGVR